MSENVLSKAEQSALCVSYEVNGRSVELDMPFVKQYLVRGNAAVSDQEVLFFLNTCKSQGLDPRVNGEVYLIKYSKDAPAQMVVGKDAYLRRAFNNPNYLGKSDGITVLRGNSVVQKEGCCLYPGEELLGGWCKVTYLRNGAERTAFKEVSLKEYSSDKSNWKAKPSTMINKVAISQCVRDAFPQDYEGLYSEEEMVASGAIPQREIDAITNEDNGGEVVVMTDDDIIITSEQRTALMKFAEERVGRDNMQGLFDALKAKYGYESTHTLTVAQYNSIMSEIGELNKSA